MAWNDTLDNDQRAAAAAKGWDRLSDTEAAQTMFKSYVNLEKTRPDPARTITLPATADDPAWAAVYQRLGAPADVAGYQFEGVTFRDGTVPEAPLLDFVKQTAAKYHMSIEAAKGLAADLVGFTDSHDEAAATSLAEKLKVGEGVLKEAWKDNYDNNTAVASRAFGALGLEKEVVDILVENLGVDKTMQLGYTLGQKMGEPELLKGDPNLAGNNQGGEVTRTRDEAMRERNRLTNDVEFQKKFAAGDAEAMKLVETLAKQIVGPDAANWQPAPKGFGRTRDDQTGQMIEYV